MNLTFRKNKSSIPKESYLVCGLIILLVGLIAATILLASVPPVDRDALTHHLFVPKLYLQHGGIYEIPEIVFSYYPMNLDLLYMIPLYFGNDIVPKYIHYLFALLTGWLICHYLKKSIGTYYGLLGTLFFLSIPVILKLSITVYVDLGLVFFTTASLLLLLQWAERNFQNRFLVLAGLCCGLAAGTKYNGLVSIVLLTLFVPILYMRSSAVGRVHPHKAIGYGVLFFAIVMVVYSPWFIRNYTLTGNPIYPLHDSLFNNSYVVNHQQESENLELTRPQTSKGYSSFQRRHDFYGETWWQALLLPVRFFFEGQDNDPRYFDGKLNPFLFILPFFAFWRMRNTQQEKIEIYFLFSFAWLYFFFVFFQGALRIRYITPAIPPLIILSILGLANIIETLKLKSKNICVGFIVTIVSALLIYNFAYIYNQFTIIQPLDYLRDKVSKDAYIAHFIGEYQVQQFANSSLTEKDSILAIYVGNRGYYFDTPVVFDATGAQGVFVNAVINSNEPAEIVSKLEHLGFSHLFIRLDLFLTEMNRLIPKDKIILVNKLFQQNVKQLRFENNYVLFLLINDNGDNAELNV